MRSPQTLPGKPSSGVKSILMAFWLFAVIMPSAQGAEKDSAWKILKHITHRSTLAFMIDGVGCIDGRIKSVADHSITIDQQAGGPLTIEREKLLRVSGFGVGTIYSGRSSWDDVKGIRPDLGQRSRVITRDGRRHEGESIASDQEIVVHRLGKEETITKSEVVQVFYFTDRPASDVLDEMVLETPFIAVLDPELWIYMIQKSDPLAVLLYDSSLPEDNQPIPCSR